MRIRIYIFLLLLMIISSCKGEYQIDKESHFIEIKKDIFDIQYSKTVYQKIIGGNHDEVLKDIIEDTNGDIIIIGTTNSFGNGDKDIAVMRLNQTGDLIWQKTYGGKKEDQARSICIGSDGGFIIIGLTESFGARNGDIWIIKIDKEGNLLWQKTYGGERIDDPTHILKTNKENYIISCYSGSFSNSVDVWIIEIDNDGEIIWEKKYGKEDLGVVIDKFDYTNDDGFIFLTITPNDASVFKIVNNGEFVWENKITNLTPYTPAGVIRLVDDGYLVYFTTDKGERKYSGKNDIIISKLNRTGEVFWEKRISIGGVNADVTDAIELKDNTYLISCTTGFHNNGYESCLLRLDKNGNLLMKEYFEYEGNDYLSTLKLTNNDNILCGGNISYNSSDFWLLKLKIEND